VNVSSVLRRILVLTAVLAATLAVVGGVVGYLAAGPDGLVSVLWGVAVAVVFAGLSAATLIVALRFEFAGFFGVVMGGWLVRTVVFIVALLLLRDQPFIEPVALFLSLVVAIVGTVAIDAAVVLRARVSYVDPSSRSDEKPGAGF
jgi:hypothetical protein